MLGLALFLLSLFLPAAVIIAQKSVISPSSVPFLTTKIPPQIPLANSTAEVSPLLFVSFSLFSTYV
jgi:hypothetical protein